jgi:hypothetical protein
MHATPVITWVVDFVLRQDAGRFMGKYLKFKKIRFVFQHISKYLQNSSKYISNGLKNINQNIFKMYIEIFSCISSIFLSKSSKRKKNAHRGQSVRYRSWWKQGNINGSE